MSLTNKQQRHLRSLAHSLKPVVAIGNLGLTDAVINETNLVLETHELIKAKVNAETREEKAKFIESLAKQTDAEIVQTIGHIAVLYRPKKKNPIIILP